MALVINWKSPKGINTPQEIEQYLGAHGIRVRVSQSHRVPSGKLNTTFDGEDSQMTAVWDFIKNLEKQEMIAKFKKKRASLGL